MRFIVILFFALFPNVKALGGAVRAENVGGAEVVPLLVLSAALRSSSAGVGLISSGSAVSRSRKMQQNNACNNVISK